MLEVQEISLSYKDHGSVLKNINLAIEKGSFVCIVGDSGTGKSSLLRVLAGLQHPDSGRVLLNGNEVESPNSKLVAGHDNIKMVFQDFQLKSNMSVMENLTNALLGFDQEFVKYKINALLHLCHLDNIKNKDVSLLSGGQKQRLAFARALSTEPEVILMDEPFSNLDPQTKQLLLQETREIASETNTTIILVTHDTRDAMEAADRVIILDEGNIVQDDHPKEVYYNPVSPKVARHFGYINILDQRDLTMLGLEQIPNRYTSFGLRPESISLDRNGIQIKVSKVIFKGHYHILEGILQSIKILFFDHSREIIEGATIGISMDWDSLIKFK